MTLVRTQAAQASPEARGLRWELIQRVHVSLFLTEPLIVPVGF